MFSFDLTRVAELVIGRLRWKEVDQMLGNENWLENAKAQGILPGDGTYRWSDPDKVAARSLEHGYEIAWIEDRKKRTRQKVVNRSGQILIRKP